MIKASIKYGELDLKGVKFKYEIFFKPNKQKPEVKTYIINKFGDRIVKGKICLGITKEIVKETLENNDCVVIAFIKNAQQNDEASGALQYWDWCNTSKKQLWIGDLCRVTETIPKPSVSPVEALLELFSSIGKSKYALSKIHLMVQDDGGDNFKILPDIYKKYGFTENIESCPMDGYIIMEKDISKSTSRLGLNKRRTRKRIKHSDK